MQRLLLGNIEVYHLCASRFRLDGGTMFGVVPKLLWEKVSPPDARNRVELACNCLLVRQDQVLTLVDTGCGSTFTSRELEIFAFDPAHSLTKALAANGFTPDQVTRVVLTHLHFDHAGGALEWVDGRLRPLFPRARYLVQRGEWADALQGVSIMKSSYRPEALLPLKASGQLHLLDGDTDLDGQLSTWVTGGHTAHHQGLVVRAGSQTLVYPGELVPTRAHLRPHWNMAYDMFPHHTLTRKKVFLDQALAEGWIIAWDHDPRVAWSRLVSAGDHCQAAEFEL
ncbi:MAG: MBL fold metallo-hydrolase [Candidatus Latescibacteria bacterium]|nr:MBL fold metallo-hydrolase [Candidatus Latescibacterota bacterium]